MRPIFCATESSNLLINGPTEDTKFDVIHLLNTQTFSFKEGIERSIQSAIFCKLILYQLKVLVIPSYMVGISIYLVSD